MTKKSHILKAAVAAICLMAPMATAESAEFKIISRTAEKPNATFQIERMHDFEANVSLAVRTDPRLVPSARILEMVASIDIKDGAGISIRRGYAIDAAHDLVLAWSGGTAEITQIQQTPQGLVVAGLFKDHQGRIVSPPTHSLAAYTTAGQRLCFEQTTVSVAPKLVPMSFVVLIDRSGSMTSVFDEVRSTAYQFLDDLPDQASCAVGTFSDTWSFSGLNQGGAKQCRRTAFDLNTISAGGNTNLFGPLEEAYRWLGAPGRDNHQKAVIVITDGRINQQVDKAKAVAALKRDAVTFVYFLGAQEDKWLKGIADNYLGHKGALQAQLSRYFSIVSAAYRKQVVLQLRQCPATQTSGKFSAP